MNNLSEAKQTSTFLALEIFVAQYLQFKYNPEQDLTKQILTTLFKLPD